MACGLDCIQYEFKRTYRVLGKYVASIAHWPLMLSLECGSFCRHPQCSQREPHLNLISFRIRMSPAGDGGGCSFTPLACNLGEALTASAAPVKLSENFGQAPAPEMMLRELWWTRTDTELGLWSLCFQLSYSIHQQSCLTVLVQRPTMKQERPDGASPAWVSTAGENRPARQTALLQHLGRPARWSCSSA